MKKLLSLVTALAFAATVPAAQAATPKAAEDPTATVIGVDQPAPKVKRTPAAKPKPAPHSAKKAAPRTAKKGAPHQARKAAPKKRATAKKKAQARHVRHHVTPHR